MQHDSDDIMKQNSSNFALCVVCWPTHTQSRFNELNLWYSIMKLTEDAPYLAVLTELWRAFCEYSGDPL